MGKQPIKRKYPNEPCIYYSPNSHDSNTFDILVSRRIGGKSIQYRKTNVRFISKAREVRNNLLKKIEAIRAKTENGDITWGEALSDYLKDLAAQTEANLMTPATYHSRKTTLELHTKHWANKKLSDFNQIYIRSFLLEALSDRKPATKNTILKYIRQVFTFQISNGNRILKSNPASGISISKINHRSRRGISKENMEKILDHTFKENSDWYSVYLLGYQTGCRSAELFCLAWSDVSWATNTIRVSRSFEWRTGEEKLPKNGTSRTIKLNEKTMEFLRTLKNSQPKDQHYILPRIPAWKAGRASQVIGKFQRELKITPVSNFHAIRSTFITQLLLGGTPAVKVMELAGHTDLKVTMLYVRELGTELGNATDCISYTPPTKSAEATVITLAQDTKTKESA